MSKQTTRTLLAFIHFKKIVYQVICYYVYFKVLGFAFIMDLFLHEYLGCGYVRLTNTHYSSVTLRVVEF